MNWLACMVIAGAPATDDPLIGIWMYHASYAPASRGELVVRRTRDGWQASLEGAETKLLPKNDELLFTFDPNIGGFRGKQSDGGRSIRGFWLQPTTVTKERPGTPGARQAFATPLVLTSVRADEWRGQVRPLEVGFTLYLKIYRDAEGRLVAAFRNPDFNSNGGASLFRVAREHDRVAFTARYDERSPEIRHDATFARSPDRLRMTWSDAGGMIELVRRAPHEAPHFFPRPPGEAPYVYEKPPATGDGWPTARARDTGLAEAALTRVVQRLIDGDPAARRPSLVHSILVAHRGKLVLEEYFFGFDRERTHDIRSAGKTFASVMLGAAMMNRAKISPESKIYELLAGLGPFANADPRKSQITLAHLLTHSAGLACDDNNDDSPANENTMQRQQRESNWWKFTLDVPMAHDPGRRYAYCSANINLVGGALTKATNIWLPELFEKTIARPLEFGPYHWNLMANGEGYLGGGAWLRPRDLLKVGQTYLDGGTWRGKRIVETSWIKRSTTSYVKISPETTGLAPEVFGEFYGQGEDGYAWHLGAVKIGEKKYSEYEATGNGGQVLIVVPELQLAVVFTGGNYRQGGIWGRWRAEFIDAEIAPASSEVSVPNPEPRDGRRK